MTAAALNALAQFLSENNIAFELNLRLAEFSSFRIGGPAAIFIRPQSAAALALLQVYVVNQSIPRFLLGGGSNLLISDAGFDGAVIYPQLGEELQILEKSPTELMVFVPSSARAPLTGKKISALGFAGLEFLTTIPGYFGGSIIQNAGCYGFELKDSIAEVEVVKNGTVQRLRTADCNFSYRDSLFKRDSALWVTGATLKLLAGEPNSIEAKIADFKNRRLTSQPKNRRSAGSIFKNPASAISTKKAWQLIEESGLRGIVAGEAEISQEHCNFIVNQTGNACAADVYKLICMIEERVFAQANVKLEREVVLVGIF